MNEPEIVSKAKEFLSDTRYRIALDDMVSQEVRRVLELLSEDFFPVDTEKPEAEEFAERIKEYESIVNPLQRVISCLAHYGSPEYGPTLQKALCRMTEHLRSARDTRSAPMSQLLRWYPVLLLMYSGGIGAIAAENYHNLSLILTTKVVTADSGGTEEELVLSAIPAIDTLDERKLFNQLPGHTTDKMPRSEYLFKLLQPDLDDLFFLGRSYEKMFDRFEVFLALVHADIWKRESKTAWGPMGRFAYKYRSSRDNPIKEVIEEAARMLKNWPPVNAGLFEGSVHRLIEIYKEYEEWLKKRA